MIQVSISRRYARALLSIAAERNAVEQFAEQLEPVGKLFTDASIKAAFSNPELTREKRRALITDLTARLDLAEPIKNLILLLGDRKRTAVLPDLARNYREMADRYSGRVRAEIISAQELDGSSVSRLKTQLESRTGKQVILTHKVDPSLLGGLVTKLGSTIYDGSIKSRFERIGDELIAKGS